MAKFITVQTTMVLEKAGKLTKNFNSQKKAERFLKLFQGNSQFYIITGDAKYFDEMKQEMLDELEA